MPATSAHYTLTPKQMALALARCIRAKQPAFLHGSPGIGKSMIVRQVADALYAAEYGMTVDGNGRLRNAAGQFTAHRPWFVDIRMVLLDPVDLRGLPTVNGDGRAHWAIPDFLPRDGNGVVFLDEFNRASTMVQNSGFQLILDRRLGEYVLPDGRAIVAAGNYESDGGGVQRMSSALVNRFVHLHMTVDINDWCTWAASAGVDPLVIAFLRYRPELLHQFSRTEHAFPTPRSWVYVSTLLAQQPEDEILLAMVAGAVGDGAAIELLAFRQLWLSLPSVDAILLDPDHAPVPTEVAVQYAVASALAIRATVPNLGRVLRYLSRLPAEYAVFSVKLATARDAQLTKTTDFVAWAVAYQDLL